MRKESTHTICIMNDSFPPQLDGVAMASQNYAENIERFHGKAVVVTPDYPFKEDEKFPYTIIRYPSLDTRWFIGYMAGIPFSPTVTRRLRDEKVELLHCHCPAAALFLARELRIPLKVPVVMTYHTKYDIDLRKAFHSKLLSKKAVGIMMSNINSCDEVWTVSRGAGENLRSLGFRGDYRIMQNGVDMALQRSPAELCERTKKEVCPDVDLSPGIPMFLFVGRLFWYKGIRIILDAAGKLKEEGLSFRILFLGTGEDEREIKKYAEDMRLSDCVFFPGPVYDRDILKAFYTMADALLFPSSYDTNGLVVREAASSFTPAILIRGSCAAEDTVDMRNAFLISEDFEAMAAAMKKLIENRNLSYAVGENAGRELYISWKEAVDTAFLRYEEILENFRRGYYPKRRRMTDRILRQNGELMNILSKFPFGRL